MTGKPKRPRDANQLAKFVVDAAIGEVDDENPSKSEAQRKGVLIGGKSRAKRLPTKYRVKIAKKVESVRWSKDEAKSQCEHVYRRQITRL